MKGQQGALPPSLLPGRQTIPDNCVGDSALGAEESHVNVKCEPGGSSRPRLVSVWVCWREKERQGCCARRQQGAVLVLMVEEREQGGEWARGKSHLREAGQAATPSSAISWGFSARCPVHGLLQAEILERVAISFPLGKQRVKTWDPCHKAPRLTMTLVERSAVTILKFWIIVDKHAPASCCSEPFPYVAGTGCGAGAPAGRSVWGAAQCGGLWDRGRSNGPGSECRN